MPPIFKPALRQEGQAADLGKTSVVIVKDDAVAWVVRNGTPHIRGERRVRVEQVVPIVEEKNVWYDVAAADIAGLVECVRHGATLTIKDKLHGYMNEVAQKEGRAEEGVAPKAVGQAVRH